MWNPANWSVATWSFIVSIASACVALASFFFNYRQRSFEDRITTRKALTDVVSELTKVNIAYLQLDLDHPAASDERIIAFRRAYWDQRRYLANHGEFLSQEIPTLVTDIDCAIIGSAFAGVEDYDRAEKLLQLAVAKSASNMTKINNMRPLARFYFRCGKVPLARKTYKEALQLKLPDNDSIRQFISDTYLMWARGERNSGFDTESERLQRVAKDKAQLIEQQLMRDNMLRQIESAFPKPAVALQPQAPVA